MHKISFFSDSSSIIVVIIMDEYLRERYLVEACRSNDQLLSNVIGKHACYMIDYINTGNDKKLEVMNTQWSNILLYRSGQTTITPKGDREYEFQKLVYEQISTLTHKWKDNEPITENTTRVFYFVSRNAKWHYEETIKRLNKYGMFLHKLHNAEKGSDDFYTIAKCCIVSAVCLGVWLDQVL